MTHEELLHTPEYWTAKIQIDLYNKVEAYLEENKISRVEFAKQLGVTKGYVSQILNGEFDHRVSNLVKLSLAVGYIPHITFIASDQSESPLSDMVRKTMYDLSSSIDCTLFLADKKPKSLSITLNDLNDMGQYSTAI